MVKLPAPTPTKTFADPKVCKRVLAPDLIMPALAVVAGRFKLPARVMLPAEKFPLPSRLTMALAVLALVAALAAFAPKATFAAPTPPTVLTTVALSVPVTSPFRVPLKLAALPEMLMAAVPGLNCAAGNTPNRLLALLA